MFRTLTPILSLILAFVVYVFFTQPIFANISSLDSDISRYQEAIGQADAVEQRLTGLVQQKNSFSQLDLSRLDALVPYDIDEVKILADLRDLARTENVLFGNVKVERTRISKDVIARGITTIEVDYSDLHSSDISFSVIGSYGQLKKFLSQLERSLVLFEVVNLSFGSNEGDLMQWDMTVRTYALPDSARTN